MHIVDSRTSNSQSLPLQTRRSGEQLRREGDGEIEVVNVGGAALHVRKFMAHEAGPVALYLHGIEGHGEWFANTASQLNHAGVSIYAVDRRGAGLNSFERGHVGNAGILKNDVEFFLKLISQRFPKRPIFLIGNCWGAKTAVAVASSGYEWQNPADKPELSGLVLICPAIKTKPDLNFFQKLSIAGALIAGGEALKSEFPIPLTCRMFTDNPEFLNYIENDPRRLKSASKAFYFASFLLSLESQRAAAKISIPTLVLQSDNDDIVDVPGISKWFEQIGCADKKLKVYAGAAHSMDFDKDRFEEYVADLSEWILAHARREAQS